MEIYYSNLECANVSQLVNTGKLKFELKSSSVLSSDFKRLKRLALTCLNENPDVTTQLDFFYKKIYLKFFYDNSELEYDGNDVAPASTSSSEKIGTITFFTKYFNTFLEQRSDIVDKNSYIKNGIFEEFCHLVEHKGDGDLVPVEWAELLKKYEQNNQWFFGNKIMRQLLEDRNHYTVFSMMLHAYPNDWVKRYSKYFSTESPEQYEKKYYQNKNDVPLNIVYSILVTDYLRSMSALYIIEEALFKENVSSENQKLLINVRSEGIKIVDKQKYLIKIEIGQTTSDLLDHYVDESIFKTRYVFFKVIFTLWTKLGLTANIK